MGIEEQESGVDWSYFETCRTKPGGKLEEIMRRIVVEFRWSRVYLEKFFETVHKKKVNIM